MQNNMLTLSQNGLDRFVDVPPFRSRLVCLVRLIISVTSSEGIILHYQNTLLSTTSKIPHVIILFD